MTMVVFSNEVQHFYRDEFANFTVRPRKPNTSPSQCEFEIMPFVDPQYCDNFSTQLVNHIVGGKISFDTPSNSS